MASKHETLQDLRKASKELGNELRFLQSMNEQQSLAIDKILNKLTAMMLTVERLANTEEDDLK